MIVPAVAEAWQRVAGAPVKHTDGTTWLVDDHELATDRDDPCSQPVNGYDPETITPDGKYVHEIGGSGPATTPHR